MIRVNYFIIELFIEDQIFPPYAKRFSYEGGGVNPLVRDGLRPGSLESGGLRSDSLGSGGEVPGALVSSIRGGALGSKPSSAPPTLSSTSSTSSFSCEDGESSSSMAEQEP